MIHKHNIQFTDGHEHGLLCHRINNDCLYSVRLLNPLLKKEHLLFWKGASETPTQHFSLSTEPLFSCWRAFHTLPSITGSTIISNGLDLMSVNLWIIARLQVFPACGITKRELSETQNQWWQSVLTPFLESCDSVIWTTNKFQWLLRFTNSTVNALRLHC